VVVAVRRRDLAEAGAAVGRLPHLQIGDVDRVGVPGVGEDMGVVPGPVHQVAVGRHHGPAHAEVVGAVQAGLVALGLDQRPDAARARGRDGDADLAQQAVRQAGPPRDLLPGIAAVHAAEQPAAGPPLETFQKLRRASQIEANRMRGFLRSIDRSIAPRRHCDRRSFPQLLPPSRER
jgi:hypothetical protein